MKPSHEITKSHHEYVPPSPAPDPLEGSGYQDREYEHLEYPKHLNFADDDGKVCVARDKKHEAELTAKYGPKAAAEAEE